MIEKCPMTASDIGVINKLNEVIDELNKRPPLEVKGVEVN